MSKIVSIYSSSFEYVTLLYIIHSVYMYIRTLWKMEEMPVKCAVFVLVVLTTFTECKIATLNVVEGGEAHLNFTYLCNSTEVTLQHGSAAPFYSSANPNPPSLSSNLKLRSETDGKICFLHLTIDPVSRANQGRYILTIYNNGPALFEDYRISLHVEYPPGKATCELSGYFDDDWVVVHCTASRGNVNGQIACYQNGIKMPPLSPPEQNGETLSQSVLAKLGDYVYCCSSTWLQTKDRCECKDSLWDPTQNKQETNVSDPCPTTTPSRDPMISQHQTEGTEFESTSPGAETRVTFPHIHSSKAVYGLAVVVCFLILAFVISMAGTCYYFKRYEKKPANFKIENGMQDPCISKVPLEVV